MSALFSQFVDDISAWTGTPTPHTPVAATNTKCDGTVSRSRKDDTLNKIRKRLDAEITSESEDAQADPVEAARCIADREDEDPDFPDCEPMYQY